LLTPRAYAVASGGIVSVDNQMFSVGYSY